VTGLALWLRPVSYAAVGATQAADLLQFPPAGYRPIQRRARIGHGDARFDYAWVAAFTWGIQRKSGFRVVHADAPPEIAENTYVPVSFDETGAPVSRGKTMDAAAETVYGPDGSPLLAPGDTVLLVVPFGPFGVKAPARVVYVVDEPKRKGFAYGTLAGHPEDGEEAFFIEQRDDGSVWITIRAFSRPSSRFWWAVYPVLRLSQEFYTRRYLRALAGPIE
jgi:uncharacterized protein (UPF0548 family)